MCAAGMAVMIFLAFVVVARPPVVSADYDFDGFPLLTITNGTIRGGVYISQGGYTGGSTVGTAIYRIPNGTVVWSRLYVGIWNGNDEATAWVNTTYNGIDLAPIFIDGKKDTNPTYSGGTNVYGSGYGVWWVSYNVTALTSAGEQNIATCDTTESYDGRQYAILLIAIYENSSMPLVDYWVNEGAVCLNYQTPLDSTTAVFSGNIDVSSVINASFYAAYLVGTLGENDYLYFNHDLNDGGPGKLDGTDVARASSGFGFDLLSFNVTTLLQPSNNYAKFWRGDEAYLRPVNAILILEHRETFSIQLQEGKNLISLPLVQPDSGLVSVLSSIDGAYDSVWYYNATDTFDHWKHHSHFKSYSDLREIDHTMALWINVTTQGGTELTVTGSIPESTIIPLHRGWNFVGYPSFINRTVGDALVGLPYDRVESYGAGPPSYLRILTESDTMSAGNGYWIRVTEDCLWIVRNY